MVSSERDVITSGFQPPPTVKTVGLYAIAPREVLRVDRATPRGDDWATTTSARCLIYDTTLARGRPFCKSSSKHRRLCSPDWPSRRRNVKRYYRLCAVLLATRVTFAMAEKSFVQRIRSLRARTRVTAYGHFVSTRL